MSWMAFAEIFYTEYDSGRKDRAVGAFQLFSHCILNDKYSKCFKIWLYICFYASYWPCALIFDVYV